MSAPVPRKPGQPADPAADPLVVVRRVHTLHQALVGTIESAAASLGYPSELESLRLWHREQADLAEAELRAIEAKRTCSVCAGEIPWRATGRPAEQCRPACRNVAYRDRLRQAKLTSQT